jgi:hypothetical protein
MSLAKAVPKGIKDRECKRFAMQKCPPVPYLPEKDPIQETVSALKSDQSLKTTIGVDVELRRPIWHCRTCEVFLMHVSSDFDAIKKRGPFKAYKEAHEANVKQCKVAKQAKAALALLLAPTSEGKKASEKASEKVPSKKSSEKEKAPRRSRKGRFWPTQQPQNFVMSTRPFTTMPPLQKRPPRTGVVHANMGQKLLFCCHLKVFSGDR